MSGSYELPPTAGSHFRARLFHPRWDIIESALGRPVPGRAAGSLYAAPDTPVWRTRRMPLRIRR